jgi:N-acetylglucosaminyldiphosphoundecaprenol N-acetyl-beta-D-mannosaminyltransferase
MVIHSINASRPDILWVGLGCPKQERWMYDHLGRLDVPVMVGVGQAFNIHAGLLHQAPRFMREHGLEWLFRLFLEPRRLWLRYLLGNTKFLLLLLLDSIGLGSR